MDFGSVGSQGSSAVEEFSFDFMQGVSYMLSTRGKSFLSRGGDDNFIVDDDSTLNYENLEETGDSNATSAATTLEISEPAEFDHRFDSQTLLSPLVLADNANTQTKHNFKDGEMNQGAGAEKDKPQAPPLQSAELKAMSSIQREQSGIRKVPEPFTSRSISGSEQKQTPRFEATTAEAELDMLLDSFSQTSLLVDQISAPKSSCFGFVASNSGQSMDAASSRDIISIPSINDSFDDLVTKTSMCLDDQKLSAPKQKETLFFENSPLGSKSWRNAIIYQVVKPCQILSIESIDDLLGETSVLLKDISKQQINKRRGTAASSKAMDDFDSWLDLHLDTKKFRPCIFKLPKQFHAEL